MELAKVFGFLGCLAAAGCTSIGSEELETSEMTAHFEVEGLDGGAPSVRAWFTASHETAALQRHSVRLAESDTLTASGGQDTVILEGSAVAEQWTYEGTLTEDASSVTVSLDRVKGGDALASEVTLPAPFALSGVGATHSRSDNLVVNWEPAEGEDRVVVEVIAQHCLAGFKQELSGDPGTFTLAAGSLKPASAGCAQETWNDVGIFVRRERTGEVDEAFAGGEMKAVATASARFASTP